MSDFTKWMFRSRETGRIVLGQSPNLAQKIFTSTTLIGILLPRSRARTSVAGFAVLVLIFWGADELLRGVNPFRRITGAITLAAIGCLAARR